MVFVAFVYFVFVCLILHERRKINASFVPRSPHSEGNGSCSLNAAVPRRAVPNKPYGFCGRYAPCLLALPLSAPGGFILARKNNNSSVCI